MRVEPQTLRIPVLGAFFLSGAAALAYEVIWTRALSVLLGSTTYALSTMLATFMLGLAIGGALGGRLADRTRRHLLWLGLCELGIGIGGLLSLPLIRRLPAIYLAAYRGFHLQPSVFFTIQVFLCAGVMLVPTLLMGMTFPLATRAVTARIEEVGKGVGGAYTFNTLGAVLGSLLTGFLLVPWFGLRGATAIAGGVNLAVGCALIVVSGDPRARRALLCALLYLPAAGWAWTDRQDWTLVSFYASFKFLGTMSYDDFVARDHAELEQVFDRESPEGNVRAFRSRDGHLLLDVGGKIEGTAAADVENTLLLAYLPIAAHARPERMLVIGLGAGVTLEAAKRHVPRVDLVEINPGVLEVVRRFGPRGVLDGVNVARDDARNFLLKSDRSTSGPSYDVISSEPSYPTDFGVSNLFTREYYELAASRLAPGGIYFQWLPYYLLTNADVTMMVKTFASAFPHASLWKVQRSLDLILIGSRTALPRGVEEIRERVSKLNAGGPPLSYVLSRAPKAVREIALREDVPLNTDDLPILEFNVVRNLLAGGPSMAERSQALR